MRKVLLFLVALMPAVMYAQKVKVTWTNGDATAVVTGDAGYTEMVTTAYTMGTKLTNDGKMTKSNADTGYETVTYDPAFTKYKPAEQVSAKTAYHNVAFMVTPASGHKFKPTKISFDAAKVGTDAGNAIVCTKISGGTETDVDVITPLRNKIGQGNSTGYSHHSYYVNNYNSEKGFLILIYIENIANTKDLAFRNVVIEGEIDSEIYDASHYLSSLKCKGNIGAGTEELDLYDAIKSLKYGETVRFDKKVYSDPTDFTATLQEGLPENSVKTEYDANTRTLKVNVMNGEEVEFMFYVGFTVTNTPPKGKATLLKRGLVAVNLSQSGGSGNLVSWRSRGYDNRNYKFKLYKGISAKTINSALNSGNFIMGKTNFADTGGGTSTYYRLEVYNENNEIVERDTCKAWSSQVTYIDLEGGAPTDIWGRGATYTPNDAAICDMDGDGEYEIILKWSPSNEKDAASTGTTSPEYFACYKLNGKRLWILTGGPNMFSSAHTSSFVAWDFDGDGYGEFMLKTGHGAIDGEGNYLSVDKNPKGNYLNSRGKQVEGEEWITVFDGRNGAELKTIPYHTDYAAGSAYWGDSNQNRSERYLAGIAWLDGKDGNPSGIFARGYYNGAFIGAYDWDGTDLTLRWVHRAFTASNGEVKYANGTTTKLSKTVYGEGCHWFSVADVNLDGKQEITYGSGALKSDGTTLYRTGLKHGDALHTSDFDPNRPGLEVFMVHEDSPYGMDYRDGTTGELLLHKTASGDTGRGFMANFDPERDDALWQASAWPNIFDKDGNSVVAEKTWGGGAAAQDRLYWTGTLGDDFWGKGVLETWNPSSKNFDRLIGCVNGGNYTYGKTNNASKNNASLLGDVFGDWREEVICWSEGGTTGYQLVVNATNYQTDYIVPHLLDDIDYRAQIIAENCCYNQPPHLGYNLRESKKIIAETFEVENTPDNMGKYWGAIYVTYPVKVPEGVTAYSVTSYDYKEGYDTIKVTSYASGKIIAANRPIIFNSKVKNPVFVPTALAANITPINSYVKGFYCDSIVAIKASYSHVYEFRNGDRGVGFYKTDGTWKVPGGTAYGLFGFSSTYPGADSDVFGRPYNPTPTGISAHLADEQKEKEEGAIYNLQGIRLKEIPKEGIYIKNGKKCVAH